MITADDMQKIAQLFHRHTFEQSRGNPLFIVRSYGVIEAFTYADADTLSKALELFPEILARVGKLEAQLKLAIDANARFAAMNNAWDQKVEDEVFLLRQRLTDVRMFLLTEADKHTPRDPILGEAYQMTQRPLGWRPTSPT